MSISPDILSCDIGTSTRTGLTADMGISTDQGTSIDATTSTDGVSASAATSNDAISAIAPTVNVINAVNVINIINAINVMNVINATATTERNTTVANQGVAEEIAEVKVSNEEGHMQERQASNFQAIEPPCSSIACLLCDSKGFFNQTMLELHVRYVHKKIWHCAICPLPPPDKPPLSCRISLSNHYHDYHSKHWSIMEYFRQCFKQERFIYSQVALSKIERNL